MSLVVSGLSHHTSPVELRERLHFPEAQLPAALLRLRRHLDDAGVVILSTCNRVEIYANTPEACDDSFSRIRGFLSEWHGIPEGEFAEMLYERDGRDAVGHLFHVASSLDSLVVGEGQILGQVHDAYLIAQAEQSTDKIISQLFQRAFSVAKDVRSRSGISEGKVSVGSVAVDLAVSIFINLTGKTVMVIGSGKMGELALKSLVSRGVSHVLLVNRTQEKAAELADRIHGEPIALSDLDNHLHRADIIITSTGARDYLLKQPDFEKALRNRAHAPMFVIDIAVPRNVDPSVNELDNVYLYDIDSLQQVTESNLEARRKEIAKCVEIVDAGVDNFWQWHQGLVAEPTIVSMSEELHAIRERELAKTLASLPDLTDKQRDEIAYLSKRIVNAILQRPMTQLKREVAHHDPNTVLHLVKRLFGLRETP
ncbi:MAG: glutamyl-tRNA reductase [Candidatus Hydrogenedentes bacterium]|nr:glutamyl-tRNA reductase [Candidatus Hydrogenedentota bacterium]